MRAVGRACALAAMALVAACPTADIRQEPREAPLRPPDVSAENTSFAPKLDMRAQRCLALSMYWEAKGEPELGKIAVGSVVLNRMRSEEFPDHPCDVVFEGGETPPCQFSWWCDGESDEPQELEVWSDINQLAARLLTSPPPDPTRGALFFHHADQPVPWTRPRTRTVQIGKHIYYR